jgi:hypothetical protein
MDLLHALLSEARQVVASGDTGLGGMVGGRDMEERGTKGEGEMK